ncbi:MAG: ArsA family ATPase [Armatimonadetes bacterium]|nr:ArsA family ATPase [Armatimonadota bacterium]MDW8122030.1 ArsA family ATPase [Armatimonadota bacterium]
MRVLLYTGKGGVGKTSIAAATAVVCAERGLRTIILSTDPAHSLADSFGVPLGPEPTPIAPQLWGLEIDPFREIEENWATVKEYLVTLFATQGVQDVVAEELSILPGMDELFSLLKIRNFAESGEYDVVIVDCAPTGATLRLLHFPDMIGWYMRRLFKVQRKVVGTIRRFTNEVFSVPLPSDDVYETMESLYQKIAEMKQVIADTEKTSLRLVFNLEKMVLEETRRAYTYLNLFGFDCDAIIANKVLPQEIQDPFFRQWKEIQQKYLEEARSSFGSLPLLLVRLYEDEVVGVDRLRKMGLDLYGDQDPTRHFGRSEGINITRKGRDYYLSLHLPFVDKGDIQLHRKGDELILRVGAIKRHLILPHILATREPAGAKLDGSVLKIRFTDRDQGR